MNSAHENSDCCPSPIKLDESKSLHSTDSIDTENLSTRGWSVWVHSSQVRLLDSSVPHNSRRRGWGRRDQAAPNLGTEPRYPRPDLSWRSPVRMNEWAYGNCQGRRDTQIPQLTLLGRL